MNKLYERITSEDAWYFLYLGLISRSEWLPGILLVIDRIFGASPGLVFCIDGFTNCLARFCLVRPRHRKMACPQCANLALCGVCLKRVIEVVKYTNERCAK